MAELDDAIKQNSRIAAVWGGVVILLGILALMVPWQAAGIGTTLLFAILMLSAGMAKAIYAIKDDTFLQGLGLGRFLFGGTTLICGSLIFFMPDMGWMSIAMILAIYFIAEGVTEIMSGFSLRPVSGWGLLVFNGLLSLVLGAMILSERPVSGTYAVGILIGVRLISAGWIIIALSKFTNAIASEA